MYDSIFIIRIYFSTIIFLYFHFREVSSYLLCKAIYHTIFGGLQNRYQYYKIYIKELFSRKLRQKTQFNFQNKIIRGIKNQSQLLVQYGNEHTDLFYYNWVTILGFKQNFRFQKVFINLILLYLLQYQTNSQTMDLQSKRNSENRERKKLSKKQKSNFFVLTNVQQKEKCFALNIQNFFINALYDLSQLHLKEPSVSRRSYFEALRTITKGNNSEIRKLYLSNPYLSATQKLFRSIIKIANRTLLSTFFSYNSLKNRQMSDNEQRFRKRNKQAVKQSQNIEEPYFYKCRRPEECYCGWPRPTNCPLGPRIRVYL